MKKTYYAWEEGSGWIQMNGKKFFEFIRQPENKNRKFIPADDDLTSDNAYIWYEVTMDTYRKWDQSRKKKMRKSMKKSEKPLVVSFDDIVCEDSRGHVLTWGEIICDQMESDENEILFNTLKTAIDSLALDEKQLICKLFFESQQSETQIAEQLGISQQVLNYRKKKILKNLRNFFVEIQKTSK